MLSRVLFICTGNICRSPMAEVMWNSTPGLLPATSAGLEAVVGHPIAARASTALSDAGFAPPEFAARQFTVDLARDSVLLTMTQRHKAALARLAPSAYPRTFALRELACLVELHPGKPLSYLHQRRHQAPAPDTLDITDPINLSQEHFDAARAEIQGALRVLAASPIFAAH